MAEKWQNNDSARDMTRKYNRAAEELSQLAVMTAAINNAYVVTMPSQFSISDSPEDAADEP